MFKVIIQCFFPSPFLPSLIFFIFFIFYQDGFISIQKYCYYAVSLISEKKYLAILIFLSVTSLYFFAPFCYKILESVISTY